MGLYASCDLEFKRIAHVIICLILSVAHTGAIRERVSLLDVLNRLDSLLDLVLSFDVWEDDGRCILTLLANAIRNRLHCRGTEGSRRVRLVSVVLRREVASVEASLDHSRMTIR